MMHLTQYHKATGITAIFLFAGFLYHPVLARYVELMGLTKTQISLIFAVVPLVMIFFAPIVGKVSDHIGRRRTIAFGLGFEIIAIGLFLIDTHWMFILLARVFHAMGWSSVILVGIAKIEDNLKEGSRGKSTGVSLTLADSARMLAPPIGGILADHMFIKAPFLGSLIILWIMMIWLLLVEHPPKKKFQRSDLNILRTLKHFWSVRALRGAGILGASVHAVIPVFIILLPLHIIHNLGLTFSHVGFASFAFTLGGVLQFIFGKINDRVGYVTCALGPMVAGTALIAVAFVESYYLLLVLLSIASLGLAMFNVSLWRLIGDIGEREKHEGEFVGSYWSTAKIGAFTSYVVTGILATFLPIPVVITMIGMVMLGGAMIAQPMIMEAEL